MTKLMTTLTIAVIASILVIGGFVASPEAYSTYGGWYDDDDDDDCGNNGYYGHDDDDDDCGNNEPKDPCDCEKPDTLKFKFTTPDSETSNEFKIEIYKKLNYIGNEDKKLTSIADVTDMGDYQIESSSFGKDKLNSNTVFAIYRTVENADDVLVSSIEIHTSCSQDLYIGQTESDGGFTLEITDGLRNGETSISASDPQTCGDEPEPEKTGTIVIKNALTNDNGGKAVFEDFSYKVTDELGVDTPLVRDTLDPSIHVAEVPKGPYILSQTIAPTITETYTEVLITGDKKCPTTTNESFMIKKDKTVSCTIYNDDNGDGVEQIEPGNIFHVGTVKFDISFPNTIPRCDATNTVLPCIFEDSNGLFNVVPDLKETETLQVSTLVLMNVIGLELGDTTMQDPLATSGCVFDGLTSFTGDTEIFPAFKFQCSGLSSSSNEFRINYALIETLIPPNVL